MPSRCGRRAAAPRLAANRSGTNIVVGWVSPGPGFMLQQVNQLNGDINNWLDATNTPWLAGASNIVTLPRGAALRGLPLAPGLTSQFYQTRQR